MTTAKEVRDKLCLECACTFDRGCGCLEAIDAALTAERERCAKIADGWLANFGAYKPEHVSAQKWANDAVKDIAAAIRGA